MARITLEDLEGLGEEAAAGGGEEEEEEEERGRLFAHWEAVANTHRVSLPRDMAGPDRPDDPAQPGPRACAVRYPLTAREGCYLGMTVPVLSEIHLTKEGTELEREVVTAYYLPGEYQQNPPVPTDPEIHITERAPLRVITRVFYGMTTEETILQEISLFWELLGSTDTVLRETYIVAAYENPSIPQRRNEIWFICRAE
ncbi:heme-binding protein 1-like isoform X1 [Nyctibius grandis]|uniref:heme-binding protein 1-like isoform X1 n=1 Tax=Nyctibius grandis TaxID=48427 RepID=UPI0035BBD7AE